MPKVIKKQKKIINLIEDFLKYCSYKNLSNKTIKSYNQTLVLFMRYLEEEKNIMDINNLRLSDGAYRCYMSIWFLNRSLY
ncbi:hypothetical protein EXQ31_19465 [Clostridium botulinum]|uniref:site-specific integrase n=1 Tax=Clostridium botulinum TaxID=1491 RepID=UPI001A928598|nr:site-specific integrase [Clostridium botulinum]MBO0523806.1 hypothetical protein [Clostridium botulinum]MBO0528353.1 hypothetical protein [Clostridium botulinum]MBO0530940.1 hypothetical protein [Clostridium botulinum]MBO0535598.1 hypothetical protein [Clostridium botulinum]MBO0540433.1 hypothetical protein [Clostridium botulinum]